MDFIDKIKNIYCLSDKDVGLLMENMEPASYVKKEIIMEEGRRNDYVYFIKQGSVRGYVCREGKERSLMFAFEGDLAGIICSNTGNVPARITVQAMEDSLLLKISRNVLEDLFLSSQELANWGRKLAEKILFEYEHYFINYFWADKSTQYKMIMKEYPELLQRVSLKELASYLNVTPQTLSRIRAGLR